MTAKLIWGSGSHDTDEGRSFDENKGGLALYQLLINNEKSFLKLPL